MLLEAGGLDGQASLLYRDIHAPVDLLPKLAALRAKPAVPLAGQASSSMAAGEIILLTSNLAQYDLAVNLVASLAAVGLDNYLMLADNRDLVLHAKRRRAVAVVWSSMLDRFAEPVSADGTRCPVVCESAGVAVDSRASHFAVSSARTDASGVSSNRTAQRRAARQCRRAQARRCIPSAAAFYRADTVRRLWLMRWHYAARLLEMRYNVMLLDSDSLVLVDPYGGHLGAMPT
jgi:hypothetical protein